ncbi:type II toxin-antitoxin system VapC family toxin [Parafilimonas sp.]|uniref:type II toxin-antitoxin system VapC family toxin n=1 Tax=Parafilimonas sp. TaxID=1969739 RepID=UPI003F7D42DD
MIITEKLIKKNLFGIGLVQQGYSFAISVITKYEIYSGATTSQLSFWNSILQIVAIIPFDEVSVDTAVAINSQLKKKRKQINIADLFIAATAVANNLPLATLNKRHFDRIEALDTVA